MGTKVRGHICIRRKAKDGVDGTNGKNAIRLDLNNEHDSFLYDDEGTLLSGSVTTTARLYDGAVQLSSGVTFSILELSGVNSSQATISGNTVTVSGMNGSSGYVVIRATYQGESYDAKFTLTRMTGNVKYDLVISPTSIAYNSTTGDKSASSINVRIYRTAQNSSGQVNRYAMTYLPSNLVLNVDGVNRSSSYGEYGYSFNVDVTKDSHVVSLYKSNVLQDQEAIPINKVSNGSQGPTGPAGKSIRNTVWQAGKQYYAGDTEVDGVYPLDIVSDKAMIIGTSGVNFYMCKTTHTSANNIPLTNTAYWTKLSNISPVVTYLILAEAIKASFIDVQDLVASTVFTNTLAASTAFINSLISQSAFIDNLSVKHLNAADGKFSGILQFPFVPLVTNTVFDYSTGYGATKHYHMTASGATSLHLRASDRGNLNPYQSTKYDIYLQLPDDMPDGVVVNIIGDGYNYKNIFGKFTLHRNNDSVDDKIFYSTVPTGQYMGNSILGAHDLVFNDVFFIRLLSFGGAWYVIQVLGEYTPVSGNS